MAEKTHYEVEQSRQRTSLSPFIAAVLIFAVLNLVVVSLFDASQSRMDASTFVPGNRDNPVDKQLKSWSYWVAKYYVEQKKAPDVVLFGSSQMGSAIATADAQLMQEVVDTATHKRVVSLETLLSRSVGAPVSVFNAAIPGCMASDVYLMGETLFRDSGLVPRVIVLGVAPRDFIDSTMPSPTATEPYRFFSKFLTPEKIPSIAFIDPLTHLDWRLSLWTMRKLSPQALLLLGSVEETVESIQQQRKGDALAAILGITGEIKPGQWLVPANIPPMWKDNTKEYKNRFKHCRPAIYPFEFQFLEKFLAGMQERGIKVVVVGMPSLPMNRVLLPDDFWMEFRSRMNETCTRHDALYVELFDDPGFKKEDYLDTVHLNASGGKKLFTAIARAMSGDDQVLAALRSPDLPSRHVAGTATPH